MENTRQWFKVNKHFFLSYISVDIARRVQNIMIPRGFYDTFFVVVLTFERLDDFMIF